ncbi:TPA: hypothetical protein ACH3X2_011478 [Trebouxia sp. C0005]
MTSLRLSGGVASRTCQVFVRALRVPPLASRHLTTQPMQSQLTHRSILSYEGKNCGFRSSSIAACAQRGNASSAPVPQKPEKTKDQYCRMCGTQMELAIPKGEAAWRHMCSNCGYIDYLNPKMVRMAPGRPLSALGALPLLTLLFAHPFLHSSPCRAVILRHTDYRHASVSEPDSFPTGQCLCYPVRRLFLCFLFSCNANPDHACHTSAQVVGCIVEHEGKILLCKRGIEPCKGKWTLPAGYMELKESSAEGAARETWEEANCQVEILAPYSHFDIPIIGQAYILFSCAGLG